MIEKILLNCRKKSKIGIPDMMNDDCIFCFNARNEICKGCINFYENKFKKEKNYIYLIFKVSFDNMENNIHAARSENIMGVISKENEAKKTIKKLNSIIFQQFKGWDGEVYPYYYSKKLNITDTNEILNRDRLNLLSGE